MMEPLALASMEMIVKHLPAAMKEPGNLEELEQLLIASCMAGQAFTQVGLHLGHAIAHGVGVYGHVHHGTACALVLPYALSSVSEVIPDRIARIGKILGAEIQPSRPKGDRSHCQRFSAIVQPLDRHWASFRLWRHRGTAGLHGGICNT